MLLALQIRLGRPDASGPDPKCRLPSEKASSAQLKAMFADKGFSPREFVALSGAHTIGGCCEGGCCCLLFVRLLLLLLLLLLLWAYV